MEYFSFQRATPFLQQPLSLPSLAVSHSNSLPLFDYLKDLVLPGEGIERSVQPEKIRRSSLSLSLSHSHSHTLSLSRCLCVSLSLPLSRTSTHTHVCTSSLLATNFFLDHSELCCNCNSLLLIKTGRQAGSHSGPDVKTNLCNIIDTFSGSRVELILVKPTMSLKKMVTQSFFSGSTWPHGWFSVMLILYW